MTMTAGSDDGKRVLTSAIDGMSVPRMRVHLATVREAYAARSAETPFHVSHELEPGMSVSRFAFLLQRGLATKRQHKNDRSRRRPDGDADGAPAPDTPTDAPADASAQASAPTRKRRASAETTDVAIADESGHQDAKRPRRSARHGGE